VRASRWTLADVGPAGVRWARLIADELPELLGDKPWSFGKALLQAVEAPRRWGLTATPKLDAQGLQATCDFLRISTAGGLAAHWSEVVRTLFRGGSWAGQAEKNILDGNAQKTSYTWRQSVACGNISNFSHETSLEHTTAGHLQATLHTAHASTRLEKKELPF